MFGLHAGVVCCFGENHFIFLPPSLYILFSLVGYESGAFVTKFRRMMTLIYVCTTEIKEMSEISLN